ncbi:MAG: hypothetical protein QM784_33140 [Polyangiaceae bacterium]
MMPSANVTPTYADVNATSMQREGLPKPCLGCGAPMTATEPTTLHGDATLSCRFCGSTEAIPADTAAQDRFLRMRLMQIRRAREGQEAPLRTFEAVRQSWAIGLVVFAVIGGWQLWQAFSSAGQVPLQSTAFGLLSGSVVVGVMVGYVGMHRAFRVLVRPLLQARAPLERGLSARCRSCGGELPPARSGRSRCEYCGADNILDAAMARDVDALLLAEQKEYERRVNGGKAVDPAAFEEPARAFYRWTATGAAIAFALGAVVTFVVS